MQILRRIAVLLAILPLLEVAVFIVVAATIGFWNAVLLSLGTSLVGALLLRTAGQSRVSQFRHTLSDGFTVSGNIGGAGVFAVLAGFLLLLPGFLTDVLALLLLVPQVRGLFAVMIARTLRAQAAKPAPGVVDLDPAEWRNEPQTSLPPKTSQSAEKSAPKP